MTIDSNGWLLLLVGGAIGLIIGLTILAFARVRWQARAAELRARLAEQSKTDEEREHLLALAGERLGRVFDQRAQEHFQSHSETFLKLAQENLGRHHEKARGELREREQAIESLLRPIRETMQRTETQLQELDKARRESLGSITAQLEAMTAAQQLLSSETRNLVNALRRPEVRGQWGEITLKRLVELAGMVEHCDFVTQAHHAGESGAIRPDMLIRLPEGRLLVVDVKTPLDAYLEATEAADDAGRQAAYARHANVVANRIRELAGKSYWNQFEQSPEFVILFVPGDQFLAAALAQRPELLDNALSQNIILATPTSLVALLKAVAYGWRQVALAENASVIRAMAVELYDRLSTFSRHLSEVGKHLGESVRAFNRGVGSLERMVLPSARKFTELGVKPRNEIEHLQELDEQVREPAPQTSAANVESRNTPTDAHQASSSGPGDDPQDASFESEPTAAQRR